MFQWVESLSFLALTLLILFVPSLIILTLTLLRSINKYPTSITFTVSTLKVHFLTSWTDAFVSLGVDHLSRTGADTLLALCIFLLTIRALTLSSTLSNTLSLSVQTQLFDC